MAQIYRSRLIITIFFIITTTLISTNWSLPITSSSNSSSSSLLLHEKSSSSPFCQSHTNINQVYNIGQDIYLSLSSRIIYRFNVEQKKFYQHIYNINELFGKNNFRWVDTVINLNGICKIPGICDAGDDQHDDLERIHIVIGSRVIDTDRTYGIALYKLNDNGDGRLQLLDEKSLNQKLLDQLNRTGLDINMLEKQGSIMFGSFWPSQNGIQSANLYYRSGLFVPNRLDLFFSVYDMKTDSSQRIIRRKLLSANNINDRTKQQWENLNDQMIDDEKFITGMFHFQPKQRTFGLTDNMKIFEFIWTNFQQNPDGDVKFLPKGSLRELLNCFDNSTDLANDAPTLTMTSPTTTTTTTSTTTTTTKPESTTTTTTTKLPLPPKVNNIDEPKTIDNLDKAKMDNFNDNLDDTDDSDDDEQEEKDEIPLPENEPPSLNDLDHHQRDDPNNLNIFTNQQQQQQQHVNKQHSLSSSSSSVSPDLGEASALGPLNSNDNGLIWTFAILTTMLIILVIIIIVPILIIRHRSRTNQMYLNKKKSNMQTKKQKNANGLDQSNCSESVQLMDKSIIDK